MLPTHSFSQYTHGFYYCLFYDHCSCLYRTGETQLALYIIVKGGDEKCKFSLEKVMHAAKDLDFILLLSVRSRLFLEWFYFKEMYSCNYLAILQSELCHRLFVPRKMK